METINGVSPDLPTENDGYNSNGGISLFSADGDGTLTGGSDDGGGSQITYSRVYWTITRQTLPDGTVQYTGGITGISWYNGTDEGTYYDASPFIGYAPEDIWRIASRDNNLNEIFQKWNKDVPFPDRSHFLGDIYYNNSVCVDGYMG